MHNYYLPVFLKKHADNINKKNNFRCGELDSLCIMHYEL